MLSAALILSLLPNLDKMAEFFGLDDKDLPIDTFPFHYKMIARKQNKDKNLFKILKSNTPDFHIKAFCGDRKKQELISCHNGKILVPALLQKRVVEWYHMILCHPGELRTEQTICQHFTWKNL